MKGKRIVLIGGSAGIGLATAKMAQAQGATLVIAGRSQEKLDHAAKELGKVETHQVDIADEGAIQRFFAKVGNFDYLVVTGGMSSSGDCLTLDTKVAKASFDNKYWGQYFAVKYGAPHMSKSGAIVLFAGVFGKRPSPHTAVMSSINGAIESLARALAQELYPIRINVVSPGPIDTERLADLKAPADTRGLVIQRLGKPEEVAQAVLYLLTNGYTTGSTLTPDGGYLVK